MGERVASALPLSQSPARRSTRECLMPHVDCAVHAGGRRDVTFKVLRVRGGIYHPQLPFGVVALADAAGVDVSHVAGGYRPNLAPTKYDRCL